MFTLSNYLANKNLWQTKMDKFNFSVTIGGFLTEFETYDKPRWPNEIWLNIRSLNPKWPNPRWPKSKRTKFLGKQCNSEGGGDFVGGNISKAN